jgi:hypothetical protein
MLMLSWVDVNTATPMRCARKYFRVNADGDDTRNQSHAAARREAQCYRASGSNGIAAIMIAGAVIAGVVESAGTKRVS